MIVRDFSCCRRRRRQYQRRCQLRQYEKECAMLTQILIDQRQFREQLDQQQQELQQIRKNLGRFRVIMEDIDEPVGKIIYYMSSVHNSIEGLK